MAEFPSIEWFREYQSRVNDLDSPDRVREAFSGAFALRVDDAAYVFHIFRGRILLVESEMPNTGVLFTIGGPLEEWRRVIDGMVTFYEATNPVHGRLRPEGNVEALFTDFGAFGQLMAALPESRAAAESLPEDPYRAEEWLGEQIVGRYVLVDRVRTYYESIGSGAPMLCLHTAGGESRQWHGFMSRMAGRHRVIAFDLPGHGKSWPLPGGRCIDTPGAYAAFIERFVDTLQLSRPVLLGCSMGGNVVLSLAKTMGERLRAVVSIQGADYTPTSGATSLKYLNHPHVSLPHMSEGQSKTLVGRAACEDGRILIHWQLRQRCPDAQQADMTMYTAFDLRASMSGIKCPVLLVRGTDDWLVSQTMVEETATRISHTKLVNLPGVGHFAPVEAPTLLRKVVEDFLLDIN